jgi:hypothetical protein
MKRLIAFARCAIPEDPAQLLFLGGLFLLFICLQLRCYPAIPGYTPWTVVYHRSIDDALARTMRS